MDSDLLNMSVDQLQEEVLKLRNGIRQHRDQKGDDNCWLDDQNYLYDLLPEKIIPFPELPEKNLMMLNCSRYYDCRKENKLYNPVNELPKILEFPFKWINLTEKKPDVYQKIITYNIITEEIGSQSFTHWIPFPEI